MSYLFTKREFLISSIAATGGLLATRSALAATGSADWSARVTVLESCSCRMFCQCFFTGKPMGTEEQHGGQPEHPCLFNQAYRVDSGHYGDVDLAGAKFWYSGNAGYDLTQKVWEWSVLTFDAQMSTRQRASLLALLQNLRFYRPEMWKSHVIAAPAAINVEVAQGSANASLDGGRLGELALKALHPGPRGPVMMENMNYFGWARNSGFELMPAQIEAYRAPGKAFEFKGTNGLKTVLEMTSADVKHA